MRLRLAFVPLIATILTSTASAQHANQDTTAPINDDSKTFI